MVRGTSVLIWTMTGTAAVIAKPPPHTSEAGWWSLDPVRPGVTMEEI